MLTETFFEVVKKEGVVTIVSWGTEEPHLVNTWNSYIEVNPANEILIPAYAMRKTEKNILVNGRVKLALGSKDVLGYKDYQGTGLVIEGTAKFVDTGSEYEMMKEKYAFLTRVLVVTPTSVKQTL